MPRIPTFLARLLFQPPALPALSPRSLTAFTSSVQRSLPRLSAPLPSLLRAAPQPVTTYSPILGALSQLRFQQRGTEYNPSQRVRKRRHGFLARKRTANGRRVLAKRQAKKRHFLSH